MLPLPGGGENPTHSPNRKHTGSRFRVRNGIDDGHGKEKEKPNHPKPNWVS